MFIFQDMRKSYHYTCNDSIMEITRPFSVFDFFYGFILKDVKYVYRNLIKIGDIPNDITELYYSINIPLTIGIIPNSVIYLSFRCEFNQPLEAGVIPQSVKGLSFGDKFNQPLTVGIIPEGVEILQFGNEFNQPLIIGIIPKSVQELYFGKGFNQPLTIGIIPESVQELYFGKGFNQPLTIGIIPESVKILHFGQGFNQIIEEGAIPEHLIEELPQHIIQLIQNYESNNTYKVKNVVKMEDCSICLESNSNMITSCNHQFCKDCIEDWIQIRKYCPCCRKRMNKSNLFLIHSE
jgi:hypothetical protein